nr:hypothetical protein [Tanacetum cinerariifolium]
MSTKIELTLEQSQQSVSNDVLVSIEGVEELKRNVWIKGENKAVLLHFRQKPSQYICYRFLLRVTDNDHGSFRAFPSYEAKHRLDIRFHVKKGTDFSKESIKKSWGKESAIKSGSKFIPCFNSSFIEFVQPCFCLSRISFASIIKLVSFDESQVVTFNSKFVCGFRDSDCGTGSQDDNTVIIVMSSLDHPTSDIDDAFSSNSPDYVPASPDYFPTLPGNTSSDSSVNPSRLILITSLTPSLFHDDPYMKVMHAYYAKESLIPTLITSSTILSPSLVLPIPLFNPLYFFVLKELLPPKKQVCFLSSSSTDSSDLPQNQAYNLALPSFSVYTPTLL